LCFKCGEARLQFLNHSVLLLEFVEQHGGELLILHALYFPVRSPCHQARIHVGDFFGNGTEDIFRDDDRVLMVSTFQHPFYPGSGIVGRSDRMVNIPLPAGSGGTDLRAAVEKHWRPAIERFIPEMIFVSAGFDAHRDDEMAGLQWVDSDYDWITHWIKTVADEFAGGRVVSLLEGGYELPLLACNVVNHIAILVED